LSAARRVIELGCGPGKAVDEAIGVDRRRFPGVGVVADLDACLPFADESLDAIHSSHLLEHLEDLAAALAEQRRVLRPGGELVHVVPHFSNPYFYSDYTHRRWFGLYTLAYFATSSPFGRQVPTFYNDLDFEIVSVALRFKSPFRRRNRWKKKLTKFVNRSTWRQELWEELFCWIVPVYEIEYRLRKPLRAP
jgi:ubiquinone/menaquinone biosynthesis C-methylase UbiE